MSLLLLVFIPNFLGAAERNIHTTAFFPGNRLNMTINLDVDGERDELQSTCNIYNLSNTPTGQELADWTARLAAAQATSLSIGASVSIGTGIRQEWIDAQNLIREIVVLSNGGMVSERIWIDENSGILKIDIFSPLTDGLSNGKSITGCAAVSVINESVLVNNDSSSGSLEDRAARFESMAGIVDQISVAQTFGSSGFAGGKTENDRPEAKISMASLRSGTSKGGTSWPFDKPLVVAPNPSASTAIIFYQLLSPVSNVRILIHDLTGTTVRVFDQGSQEAGIYQQTYGVEGLASGLYFATLVANGASKDKVLAEFKFSVRH
jgi:hypothetical protein